MPIVKNNSKAYGYNYASLADIVNAGFELPQMRLKPTEYGEYVEYLDDKGEWQTGAKVVVPDMKGSNDAQLAMQGALPPNLRLKSQRATTRQ